MILIVTLLLSLSAQATLDTNFPRGESVSRFAVPGKAEELCFIPKHLPGADYSKKDLEREALLCSFDIGNTVAACAKTYSSNPGVDFYSGPEGANLDFLASKDCEVEGAKKEAKYKLSTSCSYTPAILGYYHFSRALGDVGNVPVAVLRTLDLERHLAVGQRALELTAPRRGGQPELIHQTWRSLVASLNAGARGKNADLLFTDRFDQSYGALSKNPRGESRYGEFFNGGTDRAAAFKAKNPIYRALTNPAFKVGREFTQANVQAMVQLRDASDFILLDTILGQQDRFGNIHFEEKYFYMVWKDGKPDLKSKDKLKEVPAELQATAVKAKEMILKDNDCGVAKTNFIKKAGLLDKVAHMDPKTYRYLLRLDQNIDSPEYSSILKEELLFTEKDIRTVRTNLKEAVTMLRNACRAGKLKLDLNLNLHFSGEPLPTSYDCQ